MNIGGQTFTIPQLFMPPIIVAMVWLGVWWLRRRSRRVTQKFLKQYPNAAVLYLYAQDEDVPAGGNGWIACHRGTASQPVHVFAAPGFGVSRGSTAYYLAPGYVEFDATLSWTSDGVLVTQNHELQTHLSLQAEPGCGYAVVFDRKNKHAKIVQLEKQNTTQINKRTRLKVASGILSVLCLALLYGMLYFLLTANPKAEITINDVAYRIGAVSMRDFLSDGYTLANSDPMSLHFDMNLYRNDAIAAGWDYSLGIPVYPKGTDNSSISCWVYNPTRKPVGIPEGRIKIISCQIPELIQYNIPVSVAGLELTDQTKAEIKAYMDDALKDYTFSKDKDRNSISYKHGHALYTFVFDKHDILQEVTAQYMRYS